MLEPGGVLIFPLTFFSADLITELYGYRYAKLLVFMTIFFMGLFSLLAYISAMFPSYYPSMSQLPAYMDLYPMCFLGIALATFWSYYINNMIISKMKIMWSGKLFGLRTIISASIGHLAYSFIAVIVFYAFRMNFVDILYMVLSMYIWKMTVEVIVSPLAQLIANKIKTYDADKYDYNVKYNPFSFK